MAAFLANHDRKVVMVFETTDAFLAGSSPLPDFLRKSRYGPLVATNSFYREHAFLTTIARFTSILSPYIELRTVLESVDTCCSMFNVPLT